MAVPEEHTGFANAVNAKGKTVDARKVKPFKDESPDGQVRKASQEAVSSIVGFKTPGKGTNGAPAAVVPAPKEEPPAETDTPSEA